MAAFIDLVVGHGYVEVALQLGIALYRISTRSSTSRRS